MNKHIYGERSKIFREHIRSLREKAGMTQRDLALALDREHGMVARIELGERRVDIIEVFELFEALGVDPRQQIVALMAKFSDVSNNSF